MTNIQDPLRILNCPCVALENNEQAVEALDTVIERGGGYAVAINAEKVLFYRSRPDVRSVIDGSTLPYPDGIGAVLGLKWLHRVRARKINMPIACLEGAAAKGWRVFVLGSTEEVNSIAVEEIQRRYPGIHIAGRLNGYENEEERITAIESARPDLVMAALGSPRQELFAATLVKRIPGIVVIGCGGALDILAGRIRRAPAPLVNFGLEWLYRLIKEPRRWRRQSVLPLFLFDLIVATVRARLPIHQDVTEPTNKT